MTFKLLPFLVLVFQLNFSQSNSESYYNQFDAHTNSYATDLNNGERFEDLYLTDSESEFRFLNSKEVSVGQVNYKTQDFFQSPLKYDLLEDQLIYKNTSAMNSYDVILDESLVASFSIHGKNFVKLPIEVSKFSFYKNGYFETVNKSDSFAVYVKHEKFKKKRLGDKASYYTYSNTETLLLEYDNSFYEIDSKNDLIKILPGKKEAIKSFYKNNNKLESQNKIEFIKQLFTYLSINN